MNYKRLVEKAGYKGDQGKYIARKLEEKQVPQEKLDQLGTYFRRSPTLASVDIGELGRALSDASLELDATEAAIELAEKEGVDVTTIKPKSKSGKVTKADVEEVIEDK